MMPYSIFILGPPGTGKSTFAASIADEVGAEHTLLLAAKPRESQSWGYTSRKITSELFFDAKWRPSSESYEADGFLRLLRRLFALMDDTQYDAIILDPLTDAAELAQHELLKTEQASTPREMRDAMSFYGALRAKMVELLKALTQLPFAARPKHVIVTCHLQPAKESAQVSQGGQRVTKDHADKTAQGVLYEGRVLPAFEGSAKYSAAGEFDIVLYSDTVTRNRIVNGKAVTEVEYVVQTRPDNERQPKIAVVPALADATLPNNVRALFAAIAKGGAK